MSRSRRKSPISGVTAAPSDKRSKVTSNRAFRLALKQATAIDPETPPPKPAQVMDRWSMAKEGKIYFDHKGDRKRMRK